VAIQGILICPQVATVQRLTLRVRLGPWSRLYGPCIAFLRVSIVNCARPTLPRFMTAAPLRPHPAASRPRSSVVDSLMLFAGSLAAQGRGDEAESVLREAMTIAPESPAPYHALLALVLSSGRDVDALTFCASMLARLAPPDGATLRVAAEAMLTLHERHAHLLRDAQEPTRLQLSADGILDPTPMVMAPEYLRRARALARSASARSPGDAAVQLTLAECELRARNATAARRSAERSSALASSAQRGAAVATQALASFADHAEARALELLCSPHVTEIAPSLGAGRLVSAAIDQTLSPESALSDPNRITSRVPCRVQLNRIARERTVTIRVAPPERRALQGGRVVGGEWIVLDDNERAWVHGVRDESSPMVRGSEFAATFDEGDRNRILWSSDERLLLHLPQVDRTHAGRAVLLATGARADYSSWLLEAVGRLSAVPELLLEPDIRFVVPPTILPIQNELLSWLGIGQDRLAPICDNEVISFHELVLVRHRTHGGCVDASVISWLRDRLIVPELITSAPPTRRLFLRSATNGAARLLVNEPEIERLCRAHGFEVVDTESLTLAEYRDLFSEAACIVSAEQPLLANLLFAPRGAEVVILSPRGFVRSRHAALAHALGQGATFVLGAERPTRAAYPAWEYAIDVAELRSAITSATT
jgi:hypothetical protein